MNQFATASRCRKLCSDNAPYLLLGFYASSAISRNTWQVVGVVQLWPTEPQTGILWSTLESLWSLSRCILATRYFQYNWFRCNAGPLSPEPPVNLFNWQMQVQGRVRGRREVHEEDEGRGEGEEVSVDHGYWKVRCFGLRFLKRLQVNKG